MTKTREETLRKHSIEAYNDSIKSRWTARHAFSAKLASSTSLDHVLNIGSYNGWIESALFSSGRHSIVSIDVDRENIQKAKTNVPMADFLIASASNLPFKEHLFHLTTMYEVIEHISKNMEKKTLGECNRVLQENGILLLSTPFNALRSKLLDPAWYLGHRHYSIDRLASIGQTTGFATQKTYIFGGLFEQLTVILLYIFKNLGFEIPFKNWFEKRRL